MSSLPPSTQHPAPSPEKTLRRLFLTVFVRGQTSRGLTKETAPKSLASKMWLMLLFYGAFGLSALFLMGQPVLVLSVSMHSLTFLALGMFIATSAGEALFNKEESEILMHRPVTSQMLLRAKATVLVQVSLYLAGAVNLIALFVGIRTADGGWLYPLIHVVSTIEEALFCIGVIVLVYQLCLRWFGRERLEGVMTTMQVIVIVSITVGSQILPRAIAMNHGIGKVNLDAWWLKILPPAWFASLDDAVAGSSGGTSWFLATIGLIATAAILWLAFGKLASVYEPGLQTLGESARAQPKQRSQFRLVKELSEARPLRWFLRDPVAKASFQLVAAYFFRDRDTKLRLYPGIAPGVIMPVVMLFTNHGFSHTESGQALEQGMNGFFVAFAASFLCLVPLTALNLIKFSQQWRASEVFIAAPIPGPAPLLHGARVAVVFFLCLPLLIFLPIFVTIAVGSASIWMLLPGIIAMPVYTYLPGIIGNATPLSNPIEEAKGMSNMPIMMVSIFAAMGIAGAAAGASALGLLPYFLLVEAAVSAGLCFALRAIVAKTKWRVYD